MDFILNQHLETIENVKKENSLLVYKGFDLNFYKKLSQYIQPLIDLNEIFLDDKLILTFILKNTKLLISKLLNGNFNCNFILYEQLYDLEKNFNTELLETNIYVIQNDLFDIYPNISDIKYVDLETEIDKEIVAYNQNEIFEYFYSESILINDINFIKYNNLSKKYINFNFFEKIKKNENLNITTIGQDNIPKDSIFTSTKEYLLFKYDLFYNNNIDSQNIILEKNDLNNKILQKELQIVKYIYQNTSVKINIFEKTNEIKKHFRKDFLDILNKYWASNSFRKLIFYKNPDLSKDKTEISQGQVIEEIVSQAEKAINGEIFSDVFLTAPTGSGKSLLFQIPAIYLAQKYNRVSIIISPLKALMYDQVEGLRKRGVNFCAYINSDISYIEREQIINSIKEGHISILYLSPELLQSYNWEYFLGKREVGLLVIDEAHLVTTWGRDFRVDYWFLGNYIKKMRKYSTFNFPMIALTATAVYSGTDDIVYETIDSLNMQIPNIYIGNVRRDNIIFQFNEFTYKGSYERNKIDNTLEKIIFFIKNKVKAIVYFPWISQIETIYRLIPREYKNKVGIYYSYVDKDEKQITMEQFRSGEFLVILATKAFGMGIDISDIEVVYHHAPSGNLSDYIQEIGRVARDKNIQGKAIIDFCTKDLKYTKILYGLSSLKQYQLKLVLQKISDIYNLKRKSNLIVSIEDFTYIFGDLQNNAESKVKSALLLIEKDLFKKYNYNVIIVRPKSLYSIAFGKIPAKILENFLAKYGEFCKKVPNKDTILQIDLVKIWERFFTQKSFPQVKKLFFDGQLFNEFDDTILPMLKLSIHLKENKNITFRKLKSILLVLDLSLNQLTNKYFKKKELEQILKKFIKNKILIKKISDLLLNIYTMHNNFDHKFNDKFIISRITNKMEEFRIVSSAYIKVRNNIIKFFDKLEFDKNNMFIKYLSTKSPNALNFIKIAYILETFSLGNYELVGGKLPQIFIRISDPFKLLSIANDPQYSNLILKDIEKIHKNSISIMEKFFTSNISNEERWDFVESYFLGKSTVEKDNA